MVRMTLPRAFHLKVEGKASRTDREALAAARLRVMVRALAVETGLLLVVHKDQVTVDRPEATVVAMVVQAAMRVIRAYDEGI